MALIAMLGDRRLISIDLEEEDRRRIHRPKRLGIHRTPESEQKMTTASAYGSSWATVRPSRWRYFATEASRRRWLFSRSRSWLRRPACLVRVEGSGGGKGTAVSADPSSTTIPVELPNVASERRARWVRSAVLGGLAVFVLAGLFNVFGVSSGSVSARDPSGLEARLTYARRARAGLAVPFELRIHRPDGFDEPIEVTSSTSYLSAFDENGANPDPESSTTSVDTTTWIFEPPDGDTLTVWLDGRVEPGVQWRRSGTTVVRTGDEYVTLSYTTWVFP